MVSFCVSSSILGPDTSPLHLRRHSVEQKPVSSVLGHKKITAQNGAKCLMNSTGGCQFTVGCGAFWPLLATPVLRSWHQCSPLGPGASWHHLPISLLLVLLPKQVCRLPTITISPWSRLTAEPLLRRLLVTLGHGHGQDLSRVSQIDVPVFDPALQYSLCQMSADLLCSVAIS